MTWNTDHTRMKGITAKRWWLIVVELSILLTFLPSSTIAFSRISITPSFTSSPGIGSSPLLRLLSSSNTNDAWDSDEDYVEFNRKIKGEGSEDEGSNGVEWDFLGPDQKLGIDIGKELMNLTKEEASDLRREGTEIIERAFASKVREMERLQESLRKDMEASKLDLIDASKARASSETERLLNTIDALTEKFFQESEQSRMSTKLAAAADQTMAGRGLEFGSWGTDSKGREVVTLGEKGSSFYIEETLGTELPSSSTTATKVLLIVDEGKSKDDFKLAELLSKAFQDIPNTYLQTVTPFRVPTGGGDNCKLAIIFSSCISDRSDLQRLLDRILKRTVTSSPPTHLVLVSALGTSRTNKLPYSMQNLLGRKLDKKREMEEALISRSRMGLSGGNIPLDYTIVKLGELKLDSKKQTSNDDSTLTPVQIAYGDALDGSIEVDDAVTVLYQSIVLQRAARNCTFSAVSASSDTALMRDQSTSQEMWDDLFLRLDGPELLRIDISKPGDANDNYKLLCEYILGWARLFEENNGKEMGLSTPVSVIPTKDSINRVQLEFKPTNTGTTYKSSKEEKAIEAERKKYIKPSDGSSSNKLEGEGSKAKVKKEGGVEVVVDLYPVLRVRAKRCNMAYDTVIKEMSEEIILKKLRDAIKFWEQK